MVAYNPTNHTSSKRNVDNKSLPNVNMLRFDTNNLQRKLSMCPNPAEFPKPINPPGCKSIIVEETFEGTGNAWTGHLGAMGVVEELLFHDSKSLMNKQFLKVSMRGAVWQGPTLPLSPSTKSCIVPNNSYFFRLNIRLTKEANVKYNSIYPSNCYSSGINCPELRYNYNNEKGERVTLLLSVLKDPVEDGLWTTWTSVINFPIEYLQKSDHAALSIYGPEPGVDISIDNIKIHLPPDGHYPNPDSICDELIINGDNSQSVLFTFPIFSFDSAETLKIEQDAKGNYMTMDDRKHSYSGPKVELVPGRYFFILSSNNIFNIFN